MKKNLLCLFLAAAVCPLGALASAESPADTNALAAMGKGFQIPRQELDDLCVTVSARLAAQGHPVPDDDRGILRSNLLQQLIVTRILSQKATDDDRAKTQELVDKELLTLRTNAPSEQAFETEIRARGMTLDQLRTNEFQSQLSKRVLLREATAGNPITEADAQKFYNENPDSFQIPERVRVAHILIATTDPITKVPLSADQKKDKEKLIREIKARAEKGEDFAALAKQYSEDPGSKDNGGEYPPFGKHQMVPEFEAAAFSLQQTNQISDVVETQFGFHIIKLLQKYPASKVAFSEAGPKIMDYLTQQAAEKNLPVYVAKIETDADVKVLDPTVLAMTSASTAPAPQLLK